MSIKPITINSLCLPVLQKALQACLILSLLQITKTWAQHTDRIWDMCTCVKFCFSDYCLCQIPFLSLLLVLHKMLLMTHNACSKVSLVVSLCIYPVMYFILQKSTAYTHASQSKVSLVVSLWSIQLYTLSCGKAQHTHMQCYPKFPWLCLYDPSS